MLGEIKQDVPDAVCDDDYLLLNGGRTSVETTVKFDSIEDHWEVLKDLRDLAAKLGVENTREHLIPYLTHLIIDGKITQLKDMAEILGDFESYVGGSKYAHVLLLPLEELAGAKQNDVRMAAIKSLQILADIMEVSDVETYFIPLIVSMTMNNKFAKRWSACQLFITVYMRVNPKLQGDLIDYHCFLSFDSFSTVRQDAAKCLIDLSEVVHLSTFDSKLISRLEQFSYDQNENVRTVALTAAISISNKFDVSYIKQIVLPMIFNSIHDISWKIRLLLLKNITKLLIIDVSCLNLIETIIQILIVLTKDKQLEVRLQSVHVLYDCSVVLYENLIGSKANKLVTELLIPALYNFSQDPNVTCKLEVPVVMAKFGKLIPDKIIGDCFVDLVKQLLNDVNIDVVFNVVKYMKDILGPQYSNLIVLPEDRLICCLKAFILNDSWEIRIVGANYLGILSIHKGLTFFEAYLEQSFLILLADTKPIVQETTIDVFKLLVTEFGMDWAQIYIVPYLINLSYSTNTYNKMEFLSFAKNLSEICDQLMLHKLFSHAIYHHSDKNPNVHYALVKTFNVNLTTIFDLGEIMVNEIKATFKY